MKKLITKVLYVDDEDVIFHSIKPRLAKKGIFLIRAKNGNEGIRKARIEQPDLLVTDIVMPKVNGFELIKELKSSPYTSHIKFMILSNYGETGLVYDKEFLGSLGVIKYLIKSKHSPTDIVNEIQSLVE